MLFEGIKKMARPAKVAVIQVRVMADDDYQYAAALFSNKGGAFVAESVVSPSSNLTLGKEFSPGVPYLLHIFGKGIIEKEISLGPLDQATPNLGKDDDGLTFQTIEVGRQVYTSFARNEAIEGVLKTLKGLNIFPVELVLGSGFQILYTKLQSEKASGGLSLGYGYQLLFEESRWKLTRSESEGPGELNFLGEEIAAINFRLYLISSLFFVNGEVVEQQYQPQTILSNKVKYRKQQRIKVASVAVLLFTFVVLLVNSFVFSSISEQHVKLAGELQLNKQKLSVLDSLKLSIAQLEQNIPGIRERVKFPSSYIFDRVGLTLPESISLLSAEINPINGKIHDGEEVKVKNGILLITGVTENSGEISTWIEGLKKEDWVTEVELVNLQSVERQNTFVIRIQIK